MRQAERDQQRMTALLVGIDLSELAGVAPIVAVPPICGLASRNGRGGAKK
jgi:hypothetical protein